MNVRQHALNIVSGRPAGIYIPDVVAELGQNGMAAADVRDAIWSLINDGLIQLTDDRRLVLPVQEPTKPKAGRGPSGMHPIGPGDSLYNSDGEEVATVRSIFRRDNGKIDLEVTPTFTRLASGRDGTQNINMPGAVIGGGRSSCTDEFHAHVLWVRGGCLGSATCPECGLFLHTPVSPMQRFGR